ncbi:heterokaryon incompatibility protein-domain-containing protein [Cubamyces menziesii]|nr:heterokaryon incompatibility protein-domain-containing protein [Cubamyces menziesii]
MRVQYAALSYVWGGDQPNRTTVDNLSTYLEGIDLTLIPKTIADAIRVAHALGIRYLWADSLCIIQDSREDKHRELRKMRDVYRHAYLTIDAANAHSASEGFLCDSDRVPMHTSDWLPFAWSSRHEGHPARLADLLDIGREAELSSYKGFSGAGMLAVQTHGSTGLRAWCLQETLMSGRCVRFSSEALQFKCRHFHQLRKSDTAYDAILGTITAPNVLFQPSTAPSLGSADWLTIHAAWANVVLEYSWRFLSYPEDKLVACAGLAEAFGSALGPRTEYLAGLWRDGLLLYLLWFVDKETEVTRMVRDQRDTRAPSWSWAAIGRRVLFRLYWNLRTLAATFQCLEELAEIVECSVTLEDPGLPFGRVINGHLILRAPLLGPCDVRALRSQLGRDLRMDGHGQEDEKPVDDRVWLVPLIYKPDSENMHWAIHCLVIHSYAGQADTTSTKSATEDYRGIFERAGCCDFGGWQGARQETISPLVNSLESRIDKQWAFPRATIKLV